MPPRPFPHFELKRVDSDGNASPAEIVPVTRMPWGASADRRGFLGAGVAVASVVGLLGGSTPGRAEENRTRRGADRPKNQEATSSWVAHAGAVRALAFFGGGDRLASGSSDRTVKLWSLRSGEPPRTLPHDPMQVQAILVLPRETHLAVAGTTEDPIRLWRLPGMNAGRTLTEPLGAVNALAVAPDGRTLFAGLACGIVKMRSLPDGKAVRGRGVHTKAIRALAVTPDGTILATASADATIVLSALPDAGYLKTLSGHGGPVNALALADDGKTLASGGAESRVRLWSMPDGGLLRECEAGRRGTNALAIIPGAALLASGGGDGVIHLWSLPDGGRVRSLALPGKTVPAVESLAAAPDGKALAAGYRNGLIILWDTTTGEPRGYLLDRAPRGSDAIAYNVTDRTTGRTVTYTLPCGSPIPAGATCTCNCVPGADWTVAGRQVTTSVTAPAAPAPPTARAPGEVVAKGSFPRPRRRRYRPQDDFIPDMGGDYVPFPDMGGGFVPFPDGGMMGGGTYCSCNKICTCIPVCQAHRLLDPDPVVRAMAEQLLLVMGSGEFAYMTWAADRAEAPLRRRIGEVMAEVRAGARPDFGRWPDVAACVSRLSHPDEVVTIMAAQMLRLRPHSDPLDEPLRARVEHVLRGAERRPWYLRAGTA